MTRFTIRENPHVGRSINVTYYEPTEQGVTIVIRHDVPLSDSKQLRWVQTITSNAKTAQVCGYDTWVDPFDERYSAIKPPGVPQEAKCGSDDTLPFFATDEEHQRQLLAADGKAPGFSDPPQQPRPESGETTNTFVTALVEVSGSTVHHLVAVSWGFVLPAKGDCQALPLVRASEAQMKAHGRALVSMYPGWTYT